MLRSRFNLSGQTLVASMIVTTLLYVLFSVVQPIGSALGATLLQSVSGANTTPPYLNYQGTLRDAEGKPMSGVHKLTFRIYGDVTAPLPEALWMEEHPAVTVRDGQFSVLLGNSKPISPTIFYNPDRFIGITLDGLDEMVPRQRFASAPFAMIADAVDGLQAKDFALAGHVHSSLSAPDGAPGDALVVNNDGNIGIGISAPAVPLQVRSNDSDMMLDMNGGSPAQRAEYHFGVDGQPQANLYYDKASTQAGFVNGPSSLVLHRNGIIESNASHRVNGTLHATGDFLLGPNARKPVVIHRFNYLPQDRDTFDTGISANEYQCTTGSWSTGPYDISEDSRDADMVWLYIGENANWQIRVKFMSDDEPDETPHVDVLCFLNGLVEYREEWQNSRWIIGE